MPVLQWLKYLIHHHWAAIVTKADKEDLKNLGAIQAYITKKTKYMDKFMVLKGKLEMVSKMLEIRSTMAAADGGASDKHRNKD